MKLDQTDFTGLISETRWIYFLFLKLFWSNGPISRSTVIKILKLKILICLVRKWYLVEFSYAKYNLRLLIELHQVWICLASKGEDGKMKFGYWNFKNQIYYTFLKVTKSISKTGKRKWFNCKLDPQALYWYTKLHNHTCHVASHLDISLSINAG